MSEKTAGLGGVGSSKWWIWAYLACVIAMLGYTRIVGPVAFIGDSFYLCDPAKYFTGRSLPGGAALYFFYRPLISLLWAPAYFFQRPEDIVFAIQAINTLAYASVIWPLRILLRDYVKLPPRESLTLAFVLALSPCALIYAPMLLTEAIYVPVFLFLVLSTWHRTRSPGIRWDAACGLLIGLCYLSRHAGSIVPVAWALAEGTRLIRRGQDWKARFALIKSGAAVVAIAAIPIGAWMVVEHSLKSGQSGNAGSSLLGELVSNHDYALAWAGNLIQYLLWSPAGFVILLGGLVLLTSPSFFTRDSTAVFVLATALLAILSTVLFQGSHWGDKTLALNRYLAPYVAPLSLVCWRYAQGCKGCYAIAAGSIAGVLWLLGFPEGINTHFPDYLAWTKFVPAEPAWGKWLAHGVFALAMTLGLVCFWRGWKRATIWVLVVFTFGWNVGAATFWRSLSIVQIQPALQNASRVWSATRQDHIPLAADEPRLTNSERELLLFLCFYPDQLPAMNFDGVVKTARGNRALRLVTRSRASIGASFDSTAPVWDFPANLPVDKDAARFQPFREENLAYLTVLNHREGVVLLDDGISLEVECVGPETASEVELKMKVIAPKMGRTLHVANAAGDVPSSMQIPAGTLKKGWYEVRVPLKLQPGINSIKLSVDGPLAKLGRRTTRLVISEKIDIRSLEK